MLSNRFGCLRAVCADSAKFCIMWAIYNNDIIMKMFKSFLKQAVVLFTIASCVTLARADDPNPSVGTTHAIFVAKSSKPKTVVPGASYFNIQVLSSQAAFTGKIWEKVERVVVTSQVTLNGSTLGDQSTKAIQVSRKVDKDRAGKLGIQPNLVDLTPATIEKVTFSIDFIVDKKNLLANLLGAINNSQFSQALSLAPAQVAVAKKVSDLSQQIMNSFIPIEEQQPILQFTGDLDIAGEKMQEGYYVILGTQDPKNAFPALLPKLKVQPNGELLADEKPVTQWSYIILDVTILDDRTEALGYGAWPRKLREARRLALQAAKKLGATDAEKKEALQKCQGLIEEAHALLDDDPLYLELEATKIIDKTYKEVNDTLFPPSVDKGFLSSQPLDDKTKALLGVKDLDELEASVESYKQSVALSMPKLNKLRGIE